MGPQPIALVGQKSPAVVLDGASLVQLAMTRAGTLTTLEKSSSFLPMVFSLSGKNVPSFLRWSFFLEESPLDNGFPPCYSLQSFQTELNHPAFGFLFVQGT